MPYQRVTLERLRAMLKARWEAQPFWSDADALDAINEALQVWNLLTGIWKTRVLTTTAGGAGTIYNLPSPMVYRMRIEWNGIGLSPASREDLNLNRYRWREETVGMAGVPSRPMVWAAYGLTAFTIWPADTVMGNSLTIDGVTATPVLDEDADYLDLGEETLTLLLGYALHAAAFKKGGQFFEATQPHYQRFLQGAIEENGQLKASAVFRRMAGLERRDLQKQFGTPTLLDGRTA